MALHIAITFAELHLSWSAIIENGDGDEISVTNVLYFVRVVKFNIIAKRCNCI